MLFTLYVCSIIKQILNKFSVYLFDLVTNIFNFSYQSKNYKQICNLVTVVVDYENAVYFTLNKFTLYETTSFTGLFVHFFINFFNSISMRWVSFFLKYFRNVIIIYDIYFTSAILKNFSFIELYYSRNENLWNDGLLIDFLQKKTTNLWLRQYVICTGFLFSECLFFDNITRVYVDFLTMNNHVFSIFDTLSISSIISSVIFLYFTLLIFISSLIIFFI